MEHMLITLHDDIEKNPLEFIRQAFGFLGIDEEYVPQSLYSRPWAGLYSVPRLRLLTLRNRFVYTYSSDRMRLFHREKSSWSGSKIVTAINRIDSIILSRVFGNNKPSLSPDLTRVLSGIYREDASRLEEMLGRSLADWKVFQTI